jgi:phosphatidylserine decarboxylase precursor
MVSASEWALINSIRVNNESRTVHSREWVGVLYFLIGLGMVQTCVALSMLQNYALPWRRFAFINANLGNHKVGTALHFVIDLSLYFLISGSAGMSGFVVMSCAIGLWALILGIVVAIRRLLAPGADASGRRTSATTGLSPKAAADLNVGSTSPRRMSELPAKSMRALTPMQESLDGDRTSANMNWRACPAPMAPGQAACALSSLFMLVLISGIVIAVLFGWDIPDYHVVRGGAAVTEIQPALNAKSLQFMYAFPKFATQFQLQLYVKLFTEYCGTKYTKQSSDKHGDIFEPWIQRYGVNMTLFDPSDYNLYGSVDEWFTRPIRPEFRPLPADGSVVVSPADCRLLVYNTQGESLFWLKGYPVVYRKLLNGITVGGLKNYFDNGQLVIARLAPQDYHRFHAPVGGTVVQMFALSGTYWSVSSDAARSGNDAFLNLRQVVIIDAGAKLGYVAYVGVGATCVGSVRFDVEPLLSVGSRIERGQPLGSMHFGGSTVLVLFSTGRVVFDSTLIQRSLFGIETLVDVNSAIGATR